MNRIAIILLLATGCRSVPPVPPVPPIPVRASVPGPMRAGGAASARFAVLKWEPSPSSDVSHYRVFHSTNATVPLSAWTVFTNVPCCEVIVPLTEPEEWFQVRAVSAGGLESDWARKFR